MTSYHIARVQDRPRVFPTPGLLIATAQSPVLSNFCAALQARDS